MRRRVVEPTSNQEQLTVPRRLQAEVEVVIVADSVVEHADQIVKRAWQDLGPEHRALLESIGATQWHVTNKLLGAAASALLISAGSPALSASQTRAFDAAIGVWVPELRVTLINAEHRKFDGLDEPSLEAAVADVAWHEWGHALSVHRTENDDISKGAQLLTIAPRGIAENIRSGGYRRREITHELVANLFALLMARRRAGGDGKPEWLEDELWNLMKKTTG